MTDFHDEFTDLLGAYALDAVEPDERARIEAHLHTCPWCAAEVAEHREVAAYLSHSGTDAPDGVWDRIAAELSPPAPPMRLSLTPGAPGSVEAPLRAAADPDEAAPAPDGTAEPDRTVVPIGRARSFSTRTFVAVVSAAAILLAVVGLVAVDQSRQVDRIEDESASGTIPPSAGDLSVKLTGDTSDMGATAVVSDTGRGYLVSHDLPAPGADELYQLWGQVDGVVLSLGTFGADTDVVSFQVDPDRLDGIQAFAVTKEISPGVVASQNDPVLVGEVA